MNHNIRAVLDGADQVGSAEGVVDDQRQAVLVGDFRNGVDVGNVGVGIAQGFQIDGLGVGLDGGFHLGKVMGVHKGGSDSVLGQGVSQQIVAAAVDGLLGNDVIACLCQSLNGVGDGCRAGGGGQRRDTALQSCDALLQHILGGVGQTAIDVAGIRQTEPCGGVGGVAEYIGSGLVNGNSTGVGGRVGLLLTDMELQGFKFIVRHSSYLFHYFYRYKNARELRIRPKRSCV